MNRWSRPLCCHLLLILDEQKHRLSFPASSLLAFKLLIKASDRHVPFVHHALCTVLFSLLYFVDLSELPFVSQAPGGQPLSPPAPPSRSHRCLCLGKPKSHPLNNTLRGSQLLKEGKGDSSLPNREGYVLVSSISVLESYYHASISNIRHRTTIWSTLTKICQGQQVKKNCEG